MHELTTEPKVVNEMDVFQAILSRRSVREYTSQKVDTKRIRLLIEAAVRAPTAMHREPWAFVVVQDKELLKGLSDRVKPLFIEQIKPGAYSFDKVKDPGFNVFYDASTLIIICAKKDGSFTEADCWLAAENLMLSACAMDLGTCVIGAALLGLNDAKEKLRLGIPDNYEAVAPILVGFPSGETKASDRKTPLILNWL
jgi:nitroreductase